MALQFAKAGDIDVVMLLEMTSHLNVKTKKLKLI